MSTLRAVEDRTEYQQDFIFLMARTAFALMDADVAREAESMKNQAYPSPWGRVMVATAEGVLAALEGSRDESAAHFEKALRTSAASPRSRALIQAMYGSLLGNDLLAARVAGDEAYRWFIDTGSLGYLALYPAIMPTDEQIASTS